MLQRPFLMHSNGVNGELEIGAVEDENAKPTSYPQRREFRTLSEFLQPNRVTHQPAWHKPVQGALTGNDRGLFRFRLLAVAHS